MLIFAAQVAHLCAQPWFKNIFLFLVLLNCVMLAIQVEPDFDDESNFAKTLYAVDWVLATLFIIEIILQGTANNFVIGKNALLRFVMQIATAYSFLQQRFLCRECADSLVLLLSALLFWMSGFGCVSL